MPGSCVKAEEDGLHIRIPAGLNKPMPVGVAPRFRIHGDFEITASYTIVKADNPIRGYGLAATLWVETDTDTAEAVTIERGIIPKEGERFTSTRISGPPPPETRKYDVRRSRAQSRSGKIRMARVGPMVITSFADGTQPFRVLRKVELGPEDLTLARLAAETGVVRPRRRDPPGGLDHPRGGFPGYVGAPLAPTPRCGQLTRPGRAVTMSVLRSRSSRSRSWLHARFFAGLVGLRRARWRSSNVR